MKTTMAIDNMQDMIDTRDVLERIDYLDGLEHEADEAECEELAKLNALIKDVRDVSGDSPEDGAGLIRDSYFKDYAQELADDLGLLSDQWPGRCIDWEWAARELQMDYSSVDFDGVEYWVRS